jgi:hypothetical protein
MENLASGSDALERVDGAGSNAQEDGSGCKLRYLSST